MIKLLQHTNCKKGSELCLEVYENQADHISDNLRLNKISIFVFFNFYDKINTNQLEIVVEATYSLHPIE